MTKPASNKNNKRRRVIFVTGMSGAGMSTALKTFEDMGYEAVDNLRQSMIGALVEHGAAQDKPLAVGIDSRNADFNIQDMLAQHERLSADPSLAVTLLFFECGDEALLRRFSETRRRHPLAVDRPVVDGIKRERDLLRPLMDHADHVIDTSLLTLHDLRRLLFGHYRAEQGGGLNLFVTSFAYRYGIPREADLVVDVRFLANPHWDPNLRPLTGQDEPVAAMIAGDEGYRPFADGLLAWLIPLLPRYAQEGKSYLTIAIGCTGGRHRSVFVAEQLGNILAAQGHIVGISHRDLDRTGK
ncbi:MAG: RNase adapter RapZ [Alphaproteobacteria bacterium]